MHFNVGFLLTNSVVNAVVRVQLSFSPTFSPGNEYYSTRNPFHSLFHSIKHKYATESKKKWLVLFIVCLLRAAQFRISLLRMHFALSLSLFESTLPWEISVSVVVPYHNTLGLCCVSTLQQTKTAWIYIIFLWVLLLQ